MAWYAKFDGVDGGSEAAADGATRNRFTIQITDGRVVEASKDGATEHYFKVVFADCQVAEQNRLFVGNLSWDRPAYDQPETGDEVLVGFEHGGSEHPDFMWFPTSNGADFA